VHDQLTGKFPDTKFRAYNDDEAVCFLWHFPSTGLEPGLPDVIRHTALRSSDFPPSLRRATVRSGCQPSSLYAMVPNGRFLESLRSIGKLGFMLLAIHSSD
jgi:hypothetical protein